MNFNELRQFLDADGRLLSWPGKSKKQMLALQFLGRLLEWDRLYSEQEINELLNAHHAFNDAALLRRELYMKHFLDRKPDGSVYWKTQRLLPAAWTTERLIIRDAIEKEIPELQKIYDECAYIGDLTGYHDPTENLMLAEFHRELLPPDGKKELHRLQTIRESIAKEIIGYLISYHGYPDHSTFWIAAFAIRPRFQRQKFGQEVMRTLTKLVGEFGGYAKMGICVGVGNEPAMKFWSGCGFTEIIKKVDRGAHADEWRVKKL